MSDPSFLLAGRADQGGPVARSDTLRSDIARLETAAAALRRDLARHEDAAAKARAAAGKKRQEADRTRSDSARRSALRTAGEQDKKLVAAEKRMGELTTKLAANSKAQLDKRRSLTAAERSERQVLDRDVQRRRREEKTHAQEVARLSRPIVRHVEVRAPQPEPLRVLYLTANAEAEDSTTVTPDGSTTTVSRYLRLDREVREVQQTLRGAKYRDLVDVQHRPAATAEDLIDALNDVRPHLVHFSGHGWTGGIVFDNGDLDHPQEHPVEFDLLAEVLAATSTPPQVLVLNACETLHGAELLLPAVPVVIAMADTIDDTAAIVLARRFYAAIASAQPVGVALAQAQAQAAMRLTTPEDADLPRVAVRDDIDADVLVLVRPDGPTPKMDLSLLLLQEHGLSPSAVTLLRHVQSLEADGRFSGVVSGGGTAVALDMPSRAVRIELERLLDDGYLAASDRAEDYDGSFDFVEPRLTTRGVAALARRS
jgi:hypothetical protein